MSLDLKLHENGGHTGVVQAFAAGQPAALFSGRAAPRCLTRVEVRCEAGVAKQQLTPQKAPVRNAGVKEDYEEAPVKKAAVPKQAAAKITAVSRKKAAPAKNAVATKKAASEKQKVRKGV